MMFRNRELRSHAIYTCVDWCGGVYATPTYQGAVEYTSYLFLSVTSSGLNKLTVGQQLIKN